MNVKDQVRQILIDSDFRATAQDTADAIGVTVRQLTTLMQANETTWKSEKQKARVCRARQLWGTIPQAELSMRLGFKGNHPHKVLSDWRLAHGLDEFRTKYGRRATKRVQRTQQV